MPGAAGIWARAQAGGISTRPPTSDRGDIWATRRVGGPGAVTGYCGAEGHTQSGPSPGDQRCIVATPSLGAAAQPLPDGRAAMTGCREPAQRPVSLRDPE